jgi:hypothetical protein
VPTFEKLHYFHLKFHLSSLKVIFSGRDYKIKTFKELNMELASQIKDRIANSFLQLRLDEGH